jgi:uncharacterized protein YggU (UPF0235/DUF167 family)
LRVSPGAERTEIVGRHGDGWKVRVRAARERGRANDALLDLLADVLEVRRSSLDLVAGVSARDKVIEVQGLTLGEAEAHLEDRRRRGTT